MYIWNTKSLVIDFKNNDVSQRETMKYLLTITLLMLFGTSFDSLFPTDELAESDKIYLYIEYLAIALITVIGIFLCYDKNQKSGGDNFIERFLCLALPVSVRAFTCIFILILCVEISCEHISAGGFDLYLADPINTRKYDLFYDLFYECFFYSGIYKAITKINEQPTSVENKI